MQIVKTNIPRLDAMLGGRLKYGLHCVTGGPSSYKTALLLQIAYLAALDGCAVQYIGDEVGMLEVLARLTSRWMYVESITQLMQSCGSYSWSEIEELISTATEDGGVYVDGLSGVTDYDAFVSLLNRSRQPLGDILKVDIVGNSPKVLHVSEMGEYLESSWTEHDTFEFLFGYRLRYFTSLRRMCESLDSKKERGNFFDEKLCGNADLIIIDPVNSLRTCEWKGQSEQVRDTTPESKRALMEELVEQLDNWGRSTNTVVIGVFHGNRSGSKFPQHPSMADYKETSMVEYRGISAMELVRADDMKWSGHPRPPIVADGSEAVGLFLLKSRSGSRTEQNKPIWLAADGAHNFIQPVE